MYVCGARAHVSAMCVCDAGGGGGSGGPSVCVYIMCAPEGETPAAQRTMVSEKAADRC